MQNKKGVLRRFAPYLLSYQRELILALFIGIFGGASSVYLSYLAGHAVDQMLGVNQVNFTALTKLLLNFIMIIAVSALSQWLIAIIANRITYLSVAQLRKDSFTHLNNLSIRYYDSISHGDLISRFTNDLDNVADACLSLFNSLFSGLTIVVIALGAMLYLSPQLTLVVLATTPLVFLVTLLVARGSQKQFQQQQKFIGDISSYVNEVIGEQKIVKMFQYEEFSEQQFNSINSELYHVGQKAQFISSLTNPLSRFIDHLAYGGIGLVGGLLIISSHTTFSVGLISSFTLYSSQFSKPFIELSGITTQLQTAYVGLQRIFHVLDHAEEQSDSDNTIELTSPKGAVTFENVAFSYDKKTKLIDNFNLIVKPGQTVAIVGKTGAGKSTLVNLLMRFYEIDSGKITIDGIDIRDITRDSLRKSFGMVLQDTWLFAGTIRDNLTFLDPSITDNDIWQAVKSAKIDHFISGLPHKLDTSIGENGVEISEGQRQLLTIARTMLSNPQMLILDEATSSIDTLTEEKVQQAFEQLMTNRTSFVIAHRLSTIKNADQIILMDNGKIVEVGTHDELIMRPNSAYRQLYEAQFKQ